MNNLNRIEWLAQNLWYNYWKKPVDNQLDDKWQFLQYEKVADNSEKWYHYDINNEVTLKLLQIDIVLNNALISEDENKIEEWILLYEMKKLEAILNKFLHKRNRFDDYKPVRNYYIDKPQWDFEERLKKTNILIEKIVFKPEERFLNFYIWWTRIFILDELFDDLMKEF